MSSPTKQINPKALAIFDIDGVVRDVSTSYRRAIADTVEHFTKGEYRPTGPDIDNLKSEGIWNNDWKASCEMIRRYFASISQPFSHQYEDIVSYFQTCYLGTNFNSWNGYICQEQLLVNSNYFQKLTESGIGWGFFSGAPTAEAKYVLNRLLIETPVLVAMEDAPDKPNATGLFKAILQLSEGLMPVVYAGDTVADMMTVKNAREKYPDRRWVAVGILPPHVQQTTQQIESYSQILKNAGAEVVLKNIQELTGDLIEQFIVEK